MRHRWLVTFSVLALPLGLLIGISLGALGGGGSILTVPALVYVIGENPQNATSASLVIVGVTALTGTIGYAHSRRVRWGPGLVFGFVGIGGSLLGSDLSKLVNPNVLLLAFAGLMLLAAGAMLQRSAQPSSLQPSAPRVAADGLTAKRLVGVATVGTVVGFMTGLFGVGGGFVVVPGERPCRGLTDTFARPSTQRPTEVIRCTDHRDSLLPCRRTGVSRFRPLRSPPQSICGQTD